tara:strand:- start:4364 stop:4684 length:321 start_codon:yes stop_codon:yes gene_type:complete
MNRYLSGKLLTTVNNNIRSRGLRYYSSAKYPLVSLSQNDIYAITEFGDRLENLAFQFYGDVTLYWIIAIANPNIIPFDSLFIPIGSQIRIPQNIAPIIDSYKELNR